MSAVLEPICRDGGNLCSWQVFVSTARSPFFAALHSWQSSNFTLSWGRDDHFFLLKQSRFVGSSVEEADLTSYGSWLGSCSLI